MLALREGFRYIFGHRRGGPKVGEWGMGNGEWGMGNGELRIEN